MASIDDLNLTYRLFMRVYRYRTVDGHPVARLGKPLAECKLALITSAALHLPEQPAFNHAVRGGDCSFRELPGDVEVNALRIAHRSQAFDQTGALRDRNLVFPLDRFRELAAHGTIGTLNHRHFSFMGSITAPGRLISETAPSVADRLRQDKVDGVLLVPA
jgi:D-proline reductase (dithiol) PrdB